MPVNMYVNQTALRFHQVFKFGYCLLTKKMLQTLVVTHNSAVSLECASFYDSVVIESLIAQMLLMKLTVVSISLEKMQCLNP